MNDSAATQSLCTKPTCKKENQNDTKINLQGTLPIDKPMNRKEIMDFYGIQSYTTLTKIFKPICEKIDKKRRLFFSPQLRIIRHFMDGVPVEY